MKLNARVKSIREHDSIFTYGTEGYLAVSVDVEYELADIGRYGRMVLTVPAEDAPQLGEELIVEVSHADPA